MTPDLISKIAAEVGTPFYLYSEQKLRQNFQTFADAVKSLKKTTVCFAVKSNFNPTVLKIFASMGAGADIVSGAELELALQAGIPANKIVFSGVGKTRAELTAAIAADIKQINAESESEIRLIDEIALELGKTTAVGIRVNPDVDAHTHEKITTGKKENKFGIDWNDAYRLFLSAEQFKGISLHGIEVHVGSQILDLEPFREAFVKTKRMLAALKEKGVSIQTVDVGGGLGVVYKTGESAPSPADYIAVLQDVLSGFDGEFVFEPGRCLSGDAGVLVASVVRVKQTGEKSFAVLDAGMNDLVRPAMYDAYHNIVAVKGGEAVKKYDVVGPVCESADIFGKDRMLPDLSAGDLVMIETAGAYGAAMASNYNGRPLAAEVLVDGDRYAVIRRRQTVAEMTALCQPAPWI
ncbi:MAG TPA: diaminopimelate decarboxylase [Alphaproteobacteria bacterium]|nr:diaminopimelate decarboxylase [Alphaproteobacteria bacterium]